MTDQKPTDTTLHSLNKLIETCLDGELGYRTAAEHLHSSRLRIVLTDHAIRRAQFAEELRAEVERLGGNPHHSGTLAASLHRSWISLKSAASHGEAKGIIAACETGEDAALANYEEATSSDFLPRATRSIIEGQWRAVDESREWLRQVHQEIEAGVEYRD